MKAIVVKQLTWLQRRVYKGVRKQYKAHPAYMCMYDYDCLQRDVNIITALIITAIITALIITATIICIL